MFLAWCLGGANQGDNEMSEVNTETVVETNEVKPVVESKEQTMQTKTVSWEDHQRALADLQKHKQKALKLEEERKTSQTQELKAKEQWKLLAEQKEQEANTYKAESENLKKSFVNEKKFSAIKDEAAKLGLRPEAMSDLELLDLEDISVETTSTGRINVLGAKTFAERVKTLKPHWFQNAQVTVNGSAPRVSDTHTGLVSAKDIYDAEKAYRKSGKPEDFQKYQEMHLKFRKQASVR